MPTLLHLTDLNDVASIKRNGIKIRKYRRGIYCVPVTPNFYASHQWLREMRRTGIKTIVGVYFKLRDDEPVHAGKYFEEHRPMTLGEAIRHFHSLKDPLGYEIIVERKILPAELLRIKRLPQIIGWRVKPDAKGKEPCGCKFCNQGRIKSTKIVERFSTDPKPLPFKEIVSQLKREHDKDKIIALLDQLSSKKRHQDPTELLFLLGRKSVWIDQELSYRLSGFKHRNVKLVAEMFLASNDALTREYAAKVLEQISEVPKVST